jgi:hypothetical protein
MLNINQNNFFVDSGQFCIINNADILRFTSDDFKDLRKPIHKPTGSPIDSAFLGNWEAKTEFDNKCLNELDRDGELEVVIEGFDARLNYSSCCNITLHNEFGAGIISQRCLASRTAHGDGSYFCYESRNMALILTDFPEELGDVEYWPNQIDSNTVTSWIEAMGKEIGGLCLDKAIVVDPCYLPDNREFSTVLRLEGIVKAYALVQEGVTLGIVLVK